MAATYSNCLIFKEELFGSAGARKQSACGPETSRREHGGSKLLSGFIHVIACSIIAGTETWRLAGFTPQFCANLSSAAEQFAEQKELSGAKNPVVHVEALKRQQHGKETVLHDEAVTYSLPHTAMRRTRHVDANAQVATTTCRRSRRSPC